MADEFVNESVKPHLSASQISMILRCPRQYYYSYVLGIKRPPSGAMAQSSAWHSAVEHGYLHRLQTGELPPEDVVVQVFAEHFDREFKGEAGEDGKASIQPVLEPDEKAGDLKDQGVLITRIHRQKLAPSVIPKLVEHRFSVSLGEEFPFVLDGIWDLVEQDGSIADNKALSRAPSSDDLSSSVQLSAYSLAYRVLEKKLEPSLRLDVVVKNKVLRAQRMTTYRTNGEIRWFLGLVEEVAKQVIAGIFPPNPVGWHCSPKFCGYWDRCRGGAAREES